MHPTDSLPPRPSPRRRADAAAKAWLQWFGLGRLLACAFAVVAIGAGAFWLLRAPAPPVESSLPYATQSHATSTTSARGAARSSGAAGASPVVSTTSTTASAAGTSTTTTVQPVVVYVAGAVASPGVYQLIGIARVRDAVQAAGGLAVDADLATLNLAAVVRDGDRVYVPHRGEQVPAVVGQNGGVGAPSAGGTASTSVPTPLDLNHATAEQLDALPGIGPSTAAAIVAYREQRGPFSTVDDLLKVPGIGPAKLDAIRALVTA